MERVKTGIEGFDPLIGGGLIKGRSYLVSGEPGTGKTIFCLQYILNGIKEGESGIFVSIDEKPAHLVTDAESLGWRLQPHLDSQSLQILDVSSYFRETRLEKGGKIEVKKIVDELKRYANRAGAKRLVIDPVAPLVSRLDAISEIQEYIRNLIFKIEEEVGCTTLFTSHVPVNTSKLSQYEIEEFIVSGIFILRLVKPEKKYLRTIFVRKMRATPTDLSEYAFDIIKDRGIVLRQVI